MFTFLVTWNDNTIIRQTEIIAHELLSDIEKGLVHVGYFDVPISKLVKIEIVNFLKTK